MKLINYIVRFLKLNRIEKIVFFKVFFLSGLIRLMVITFPLKSYYTILLTKQACVKLKSDKSKIISLVRLSLKRTSKIAPWNCNCLVQAIVGKIILNSYGIKQIILFEVEKNKERIRAHAILKTKDLDENNRFKSIEISLI
jgi:hypothetical protein